MYPGHPKSNELFVCMEYSRYKENCTDFDSCFGELACNIFPGPNQIRKLLK